MSSFVSCCSSCLSRRARTIGTRSNSFFARRDEEARRTAAALELLRNDPDDRVILVTHQVNVTALTGVFPQSGEIIVAERTPQGLTVTGRILIDP